MASLLDSVPGVIFKRFQLCVSQHVTEISHPFQGKLSSPLLRNFWTGNSSPPSANLHILFLSIKFWISSSLFVSYQKKFWKALSSDLSYLYSLFCPLTSRSMTRWCEDHCQKENCSQKPSTGSWFWDFSNFKREFASVSPARCF